MVMGFYCKLRNNGGSLLVNQITKIAQDKNKYGTGNKPVLSCLVSGSRGISNQLIQDLVNFVQVSL
jgi:hypothetical protein